MHPGKLTALNPAENTTTANLSLSEYVDPVIAIVRRGAETISTLSVEQFSRTAGLPSQASVGAHYRHHLEHIQLLLKGLKSGIVDYDARTRDPRVESDISYALDMTAAVENELKTLRLLEPAHPLVVIQRAEVDAPDRPKVPTTLAREILFLQSHTVHHYAIIAMLLRAQGLDINPEFGVMASTAAFRKDSGR
jgi:hypothetical protein